jgi:2-keto-4-pentenoate hydratase/2-oxohepta-3-ene-1,7-dioic acid hydratase in catechol pathway
MKICRFDDNRVGLVLDDGIRDISPVLEELGAYGYPLPRFDPFIAALHQLKPAIDATAKSAKPIAVDGVKLLSPVANHDHEVELAVVIGRSAKNVSAAQALEHVAGFCIGLDMTIRGPEERSFRKSPDSYCVLGPWLVTPDELGDPGRLQLSISVNGEVRQDANTSDLIVGVAELIAWGSSFYTLHPGDVLLTGTPQGVGPVKPGDTMLAKIDRIGAMHVRVS